MASWHLSLSNQLQKCAPEYLGKIHDLEFNSFLQRQWIESVCSVFMDYLKRAHQKLMFIFYI